MSEDKAKPHADPKIPCDLCKQPAGYYLCQQHLDEMDGNDEQGRLAVEREDDYKKEINRLNQLYRARVREIDFLKMVLKLIYPYIKDVTVMGMISNFLNEQTS